MRDSKKAAEELGYSPDNSNNKKKLYIIIGIIVAIALILTIVSITIFNTLGKKETNENKDKKTSIVSKPRKQDEINPSDNLNINVKNSFIDKNVVKQGKRLRDGNYDIVGSLRIPKTKINYKIYSPVDTFSLEKGLAMLTSTNGVNKPGNTVVWGHNYKSDKFFGQNHLLKKGDKVYVKDLSGNEFEYVIYHGEYVKPSYRDYINRDTKGGTEITLSTCSDNVKERYLLFAKKVNIK